MRTTSDATNAALLAAARLDAPTSLAVFRVVLGALARPGRVVGPPTRVPPVVPTVLLPALALADLDVAVTVLDEHDGDPIAWDEVVRAATGARPAAGIDDADLVVAMRTPTIDEIARIRTGDPTSPERGARLVVACDGFDRGTDLDVEGPGAAAGRSARLAGIGADVLDAIATANSRFPAGFDTWFVDPRGAMVAIARSTRITANRPTHDD